MSENIIWFDKLGMSDIEQVGGKNASLGEMISHLSEVGVSVPNGFATTSHAYRSFIHSNGLAEHINGLLKKLDVTDVIQLAEIGSGIREAILDAEFSEEFKADIQKAFDEMSEGHDIAVCGSHDTSAVVGVQADQEEAPAVEIDEARAQGSEV